MWCQIGALQPFQENLCPFRGRTRYFTVANEIDGPIEFHAIDRDPNLIPIAQLSDGAAGQGLGSNVAEARTSGDAAESSVCYEGNMLAEGKVLQGRGELVCF